MKCRWAIDADIPAIVALFDSELKGDWFVPAGIVQRYVTGINPDGRTQRPAHVRCAFDGGRLVGLGVMGRSKQLWNLVVRKEYRGQGVGTEILHALNPRTIRCKTDMKAGNPQPWFERHGYREIGRVPGKPHLVVLRRPSTTGEQIELDEAEVE